MVFGIHRRCGQEVGWEVAAGVLLHLQIGVGDYIWGKRESSVG